jgi:predicted outer membrane repeat protein
MNVIRTRFRPSRRLPVALGSAFGALLLAWGTNADASYFVRAAQAGQDGITNDSTCNLSDAIDCVIGGPSGTANGATCTASRSYHGCGGPPTDEYIDLEGVGATFLIASTKTIPSGVTLHIVGGQLLTDSFIKMTGSGTAFIVNSGATFTMDSGTIIHSSSTSGRVVTNHGTFTAMYAGITGGNTTSNGGGINNDGILYLYFGSTIYSNTASKGGGIYSSGQITFQNATVKNNKATSDGGGIYNDVGNTQGMEGFAMTVNGNFATGSGGGVYSRNRFQVDNVTISGNRAGCTDLNTCGSFNGTGNGGGIYRDTGTGLYLQLRFGTVAFNHAASGGGYYVSGGTSVGSSQYSIFSNNVAHANGGAPDIFGNPHGEGSQPERCIIRNITGTTNVSPDDLTGTPNDPQLSASLGLNGGTYTQVHSIPSTSVARNKAPSDASGPNNYADQRGWTKPSECGSTCAPGTNNSDLGAYEF